MHELIYTAFACDRCDAPNAIKIKIVINLENNRAQYKEVDICNKCAIELCSCLMHKIEMPKREAWIQSFINGIIR